MSKTRPDMLAAVCAAALALVLILPTARSGQADPTPQFSQAKKPKYKIGINRVVTRDGVNFFDPTNPAGLATGGFFDGTYNGEFVVLSGSTAAVADLAPLIGPVQLGVSTRARQLRIAGVGATATPFVVVLGPLIGARAQSLTGNGTIGVGVPGSVVASSVFNAQNANPTRLTLEYRATVAAGTAVLRFVGVRR